MASRFSSIGMPVKNKEEMAELISKAAEKGEVTHRGYGYCSKWTSATGAQLWIHVDKSNDLIAVYPFFNGSGCFTAGITGKIEKAGYDDREGLLYAWANPPEGDVEAGDYPFAFDCVNISVISKLKPPCVKTIKLTAFACALTTYPTEAAYYSNQPPPPFASKSFTPAGLFSATGDEYDPSEITPEAVFTGIILAHNNFTNELTGGKFYWLKTETYGGIIDVVAGHELVKNDLRVGGVVSGVFGLAGEVLD